MSGGCRSRESPVTANRNRGRVEIRPDEVLDPNTRGIAEVGLECPEPAPRPPEPDSQNPSSPLSNPTPPAPLTARASTPDDRDTPSRPSREVQRRLPASGIDELCQRYLDGTSIDALARAVGVNRTTIIRHLDQKAVPRRRVVRKMTDAQVAKAALKSLAGNSLTTVAEEFRIHTRTVAREFRKAGVAITPRRGSQY